MVGHFTQVGAGFERPLGFGKNDGSALKFSCSTSPESAVVVVVVVVVVAALFGLEGGELPIPICYPLAALITPVSSCLFWTPGFSVKGPLVVKLVGGLFVHIPFGLLTTGKNPPAILSTITSLVP